MAPRAERVRLFSRLVDMIALQVMFAHAAGAWDGFGRNSVLSTGCENYPATISLGHGRGFH
jgi:hypothetical protein